MDTCLAVGTFEPVRGAQEVQWGPVTELDEAIVRELRDELPGEGSGEGVVASTARLTEGGCVVRGCYEADPDGRRFET